MRIGELAKAAGTSVSTLRFYEDAGLLRAPARTPGGYRVYEPPVLGRLDFIRRAQATGMTLAQVRQVLQIRDGGQSPCEHVAALLGQRLDEVDRQIMQLKALRESLTRLRDDAVAGAGQPCPRDEVCRFL